jgi:DNA-directed RNA polymerase subunit F
MEERVVTLTEVKERLEKAEAERGELTYEQKLALEHARRFARFTPESLPKLMDELKQNPKIDHLMAVRIADMAPMHADDVRALFAKSRANLDESEVQKVLETVRRYLVS